MIKMAIVNQKGGVGKTTSAINLATAMAAVGWRVLLFDLDPQGNASTGLGIGQDKRETTAYEVLSGEATILEAAVKTNIPNLSIVPCNVDLSGAEVELASAEGRGSRLANAFELVETHWDICLIDCPPSLTLLTVNALIAVDSVLVPLQCEFFALEGLSLLLQTVDRVQKGHNPKLSIAGVMLTMYDKRNRLTEQVADDVRACLGNLVFETVIPRNVRLSEAPSHGLPALVYDHKCSGSQAYIQLAKELIARLPERIAAADAIA